MKSTTKGIISPATSMLFDRQSSLIKERNIKATPPKYQNNNSSFNKTSYSASKCKKKIPNKVIYSLLNNKRLQMTKTNANTNKIDIQISVNYPNKDTKDPSQKNVKSDNPNERNQQSNIGDNYYQNSLNISLSNYAPQAPQQHNEGVIINPALYLQSNENLNSNNIIMNTHSSNEDEIEYSKDIDKHQDKEEAIDSNEGLEFNSKNSTTYFTTGNINENILTNSANCFTRLLSKDKVSYSCIKNNLIEGLDALNKTVKDRDREKIDYLNKKFELYKNALVQLGNQGQNEEEDELVILIAESIDSLMTYYNENKEKMNSNYSELFHKYVEMKKENQDKSDKLRQLQQKITELQNNHSGNLSNRHSHGNSNSNSNSKSQNNANNRNEHDIQLKRNSEKLNSHHNGVSINRRTKKKTTSFKTRPKPLAKCLSNNGKINDLDSLYFTQNLNDISHVGKNVIQLIYNNNNNNNDFQNNFLKSHVPKLDLNIHNIKNNYSNNSQMKNKQMQKNRIINKVDSISNKNILSYADKSSLYNKLKANLSINQCQSFLNMSKVNKLRKATFN